MRWVLLVWFCSPFSAEAATPCRYYQAGRNPFYSEQQCLDYVREMGEALGPLPKCVPR
jgi:hypothetical protein